MTTNTTRNTYTPEQREAWKQAKALLKQKIQLGQDTRPLHIAMSLLRGKTREEIETPALNEQKRIQRTNTDRWMNLDQKIQEWLDYFQDPGKKKLFILVDPTLTPSQKAVQAAHCAAQFQKEHPLAPWTNGTMVLLEGQISKFSGKLTSPLADYLTTWTEPDMEDKITAYAGLRDFRNQSLSDGYKLL